LRLRLAAVVGVKLKIEGFNTLGPLCLIRTPKRVCQV